MIIEKLEFSLEEIREWSSHAREIEIIRDSLLKKGKSLQIVKMTLIGKYPYFKSEISELLE